MFDFSNLSAREKLIVAVDVPTQEAAEKIIIPLAQYVGFMKIGLQMITAIGPPAAINLVRFSRGYVMLDGKFNDIPHTMAGATLAASQQSVEMLTVHASAGVEAMKAAVQNAGLTKILAVTVLTSIDADKCLSIFGDFPEKKVVRFATMALKAGIHGIVCSPKEVEAIRAIPEFNKFIVVCPGIRLKDQVIENDDQARKMTPYEAIRAGADLIVVGRPITSSQNPTAMAQRVIEEIAEAMAPTRTAA